MITITSKATVKLHLEGNNTRMPKMAGMQVNPESELGVAPASVVFATVTSSAAQNACKDLGHTLQWV